MGRRSLPADAARKPLDRPSFGRLVPVWCVLAACVGVAFSPSLNNGFVDWDDQQFIVENDAFQGLGWRQVEFAFTASLGGLYQPLGWLFQSFTYACCGLDPRGYHVASLLFHVVNVLLLHLLCVRLVMRRMPEAGARLGGLPGWLCGVPVVLYAVHPLRVEPVAWAACQAYLPGVTFSLLATLAYLRAHPPGAPLRRWWMTGSSVLVVLAVLTKGSAVVLPFVFLILDASLLRRLGPERPFWRTVLRLLIEKGPMLSFCLAFTVVAFLAKRDAVEPEVTAQPLLVARVAQASFAAWFYLEKTVWPFGITAFYPCPERGDYLTPLFGACVAGIVAAAALVVWQRRRWPWLLAAAAAYLVIAAPYLGLVRVGRPLAADRYSYAPMMPWVVLACAWLCRLAQRPWPRFRLLAAGTGTLAVAGGLMALSSAQCCVWGSCERLWGQAVAHAPWSSELHNFMGASLTDEGKHDRALAELREALRLRPDHFDALYHLGQVLVRRGEATAAIPYFRQAVKLQPNDARVYLGLGPALLQQGHLDEAVAIYREGLQLHGNVPELHFELGLALLRQRKVDDAVDELTRAVELRPRYTEAYVNLGGAFVLQERLSEALVLYEKALRLDPNHSWARISLGLTLARLGRSAEAILQLHEAVRRDPENPEAHHVLGAILVRSGRREEAVAEFEETLRLRPDHAKARASLAMARRGRM